MWELILWITIHESHKPLRRHLLAHESSLRTQSQNLMSHSPNRSITPHWMGLLGSRLFRLGNHPSLHKEPLKNWLSCLVSPVWGVLVLGTEKVTACSDGVKKEKQWTNFKASFRLYMLFMITKAIDGRHNVGNSPEKGRRVSDFWLSDDQRRSFFP